MESGIFRFKEFNLSHKNTAMKVTTEGCLFASYVTKVCDSSEVRNVLDIGTGTGLLSLMMAQKLELSTFDAVEVEKMAFEEAKSNFRNSNWRVRLSVFHSDIQSFSSDKKYDLIISNPPFFKNHKKSNNEAANLAIHNDALLENELVTAIQRFSHQNTQTFILYPENEMNVFCDLMNEVDFKPFLELSVYNSPKKQKTFRKIVGFSKGFSEKCKTESIYIRDSTNEYSKELKDLTKDYYL